MVRLNQNYVKIVFKIMSRTRWCQDIVMILSRWCQDIVKGWGDNVEMVSCYCQNDVMLLSRWCQDIVEGCQENVKLMSWYCQDDVEILSRDGEWELCERASISWLLAPRLRSCPGIVYIINFKFLSKLFNLNSKLLSLYI